MMLSQLLTVERLANNSKLQRLLYHPIKYSAAILHRKLIYPYYKTSREVLTQTFYGASMNIQLPAATDIYLTGGKTHPSEIRLAKYLIQHLQEGDTFIDIGAHYGYFTLLGSHLVGKQGTVYSLEASPTTFALLSKNVKPYNNIIALNIAASNQLEEITFFEFPSLYSEYNSIEKSQYEQEGWYQKYPPTACKVKAVDLTSFLTMNNASPSFIKIDVEGAELKVIEGAKKYLEQNNPIIIIEYLSSQKSNQVHYQTAQLLAQLGFYSFLISPQGYLEKVTDIDAYLKKSGLDSDNIVFHKS